MTKYVYRFGGGANKCAEGATYLLARFCIRIHGCVTMRLIQGGFRIGFAFGIQHDIGPVDHVHDRLPRGSAVGRVFESAEAVLILFVDAVVVQMDVVDAGKVVA